MIKVSFRALIRHFCLNSSIMGLKYFYLYPDIISRCFWLTNMIAVLFLAFLLSWKLYSRFVEMPTRVTIENQYEPVQDLPFPAVTICSPNQITASSMRHFNKTLVDGDLSIDLEQVLPKLLGFYELVPRVNQSEMIHLQSLLDSNRYTIHEVMSSVAQSCNDFLRKCFFNGREELCASLFSPILTAHGHCCIFNSKYHYHDKRNREKNNFVVRNVTSGRLQHGLIVVTDYNPDDAVDYTILDAGAAKVMYTDYQEFPTDDESSLIESNVEAYNPILATYTYCSEDVSALPTWSRNCYMQDEYRLAHFQRYHNSDCDIECYASAVRRSCACSLFYLPSHRPDTCNLKHINCIMNVKVHMNEWLSAAECECPRDCVSRRYRVDLVTGNLHAIPHMIRNPYAGIKFNYSSTIMSFFFPNAVYVKQKQETVMSLITFASNLGGVFGLCLGCSGISVLEILFYLYMAIKNHIHARLRNKRMKARKKQYK